MFKNGQEGEDHHKAKLKVVDIKRWRKEYKLNNERHGYIMKMFKRDKPPVTYCTFNAAVKGVDSYGNLCWNI